MQSRDPGDSGGTGSCLPPLLQGRRELGAALCSSPLPPQIPIAVSGVRGMGFLMKHHIETAGGQLPAKLSSLFVKVSGAHGPVGGPLTESPASERLDWLCSGVLTREPAAHLRSPRAGMQGGCVCISPNLCRILKQTWIPVENQYFKDFSLGILNW